MIDAGPNLSRSVTVRPVVFGDLPALDALLTALDSQARYRRWFTGGADVHRAASWACHPELVDAISLVASDSDGQIVGHAAAIPYADAISAEVCFEVAAPWRHQGIAGRLLAELEWRAVQLGVRTLVAEVLNENTDMLAVMREHDPCQEVRQDGVVELRMPIAHLPAAVAPSTSTLAAT